MQNVEIQHGLRLGEAANLVWPWPSVFIASLIASDAAMLVLAGGLAIGLSGWPAEVSRAQGLLQFWSVITLALLSFAFFRLYPGLGMGPVEELRRITMATSIIFLALAALTFLFREGPGFSRMIFGLSWLASLLLVPLGRALAHRLMAHSDRLGIPVAVLADDKRGAELVRLIQQNPISGLRPIALLGTKLLPSMPAIINGPLEMAPSLAVERRISYAILMFPQMDSDDLAKVIDQYCAGYRRLFVMPMLLSGIPTWITPLELVGHVGLEIKQNLLSPEAQLVKRALDLLVGSLSLILLAPLMLLLSIAIAVDSRGPVIYFQERIGRHGKRIRLLKFRTMSPNAEDLLGTHLADSEALRQEWERFQKLRKDPRITRVGRWLRRWSLDELPQIINVLTGEMSLVGPRPIMYGQEEAYGREIRLYDRARPGLTGLWQVSGRNQLAFEDRARLDSYYVRNWSLWLDLYILAKTPLVILGGEGAN